MDIQETTFGPRLYLALKKAIPTSQITDKAMYEAGFGKVFGYVMSHGLKPSGPAVVLYFKWNEPEGQAEIGMAAPVEKLDAVTDPELSLVDVPQSKAIMAVLRGPYSGLEAMHKALMAYLKEHDLEYANMSLEEYVVDPMKDPNPEHWVTNVYYLCR